MANGSGEDEKNGEAVEVKKTSNGDARVEVKKTSNGARINLVVNDLVMIVENQHRIMQDLQKQSGLDIRGSLSSSFAGVPETDELLFDENHCTLLRLVGEIIRPSDAMRSVQDHITKDFDISGFQQVMDKIFLLVIYLVGSYLICVLCFLQQLCRR